MTMRERLTYAKLFERCAEMRRLKRGAELHISYDEFLELRMDMDFVNTFNWASMSGPVKTFMCCGIRCIIQEH